MTRFALLALLALLAAGCNEVYGLAPTRVRDAGVEELPDSDADGVVDAEDNCPQHANADQRDTDADAHGDLCDDCPLIVNAQRVDSDGDGSGDRCDPHPAQAGDCLLLVDTFSRAADFEQAWKVPLNPDEVVAEDGMVRLRPTPASPMLFVLSTLADDATDVTVIGRAPKVAATDVAPIVLAVASYSPDSRYACQLVGPDRIDAEGTIADLPAPNYLVPRESGPDRFVLRLITTAEKGTNTASVLCRVEYGISIGTESTGSMTIKGAAGFGGASNASDIDAVALSRFTPDAPTCPATIYR